MKQIVTKTQKKQDMPIEGKITYVEDTIYKLNLPVDLHPALSVGKILEEGDMLKPKDSNAEPEIQEIEYKGEVNLQEGDHIEVGEKLYTKKKMFGKEIVTSPVSGKIREISETVIKIEIHDSEEKDRVPFKTPFGGKIKDKQDKYLLLEFPSVQVNLFDSKGGSAVGPIKYFSSNQIKDRKNLSSRVEKSIIVTDHITSDLYPMLSTLGVGAIIANSIDYSLFKNMIILAVPVGIISGFGFTPSEKGSNLKSTAMVSSKTSSEVKPLLSEDETLIKYIKSIEGKTVWFDGDYSRLIIPETKEPIYLKRHQFSL